MSKNPDKIGNHYYGFAYPSLVIAHTSGVTCHNSRSKFEPGQLVIVCARGEDRNIYGFLATSLGFLKDVTPGQYFPGSKDYDVRPITKLKVLTPIILIPDSTYKKLEQCGLTHKDRATVASYLREQANIITPLPTAAEEATVSPSEAPKVVSKDGRIGYVYLIENLLGEGYKIGITDNIHRRFKQLEIGSKAACIGYWSSPNYKNLEKFLHTQFNPQNVPQSEWFILTDDQLIWAVEWLNENGSQVELNLIVDEEDKKPVGLWARLKRALFFV
jgi:hypothetical protein